MTDTANSGKDLFRQAVAVHQAGDLARAGSLYRRLLAEAPAHADARHNLGVLLLAAGRADEAAPELFRALRARPDDAQFWIDYVSALGQAGLAEAARRVLGQAKAMGLDGPVVETLEQGLSREGAEAPPLDLPAMFAEGRFAEVEAIAGCLALQHPGNASVLAMWGAALRAGGRAGEAVEVLTQAVELDPAAVEAHYNLGLALEAGGRMPAAEAAFQQALALHPDHIHSLARLAAVLTSQSRPEEALALLQRAVALNPVNSVERTDLGGCLILLDRLDEAEAEFRRVIELSPGEARAYSLLGVVRMYQDRLEAAVALYQQAISLQPTSVEAYANLAETLRLGGRLVEARANCEKALLLDPNLATGHQLIGILSAYLADHSLTLPESDEALALSHGSRAAWEARLYTFSYHPDLSAEAIYGEFVRWGDRFPDPATDFSAHDRTPARRLRVGYVSPDFRKHTSRFYFMPLMAHHDHAAFETVAYSNVAMADEHTEAFKAVFDQWRDIRGMTAEDAARMVREDRIDILVDCCNHMRDHRLDVFVHKPAPIQVTWLGAAWTTGLKAMDYVLFDPYIAPEGTIAREQIVRLPNCFIAYRPPGTTAPTVPPPALATGQVTFGYSGRTERLNRHTFRVWGEILRRIPGSRLILDYPPFADPPTQAQFRALMAEQGLAPDRVEMRRSSNIFEGLNDFDILLDCFPHSGGTMLFDALWMGVPALTLKSRPPLGRIGTTLMTNLGMTDWVAETEEDYIGKAVAFAADLEGLTAIRAGLRERMRASPLMDEVGFAKEVEAAYRTMWTDWTQGPLGGRRAAPDR